MYRITSKKYKELQQFRVEINKKRIFSASFYWAPLPFMTPNGQCRHHTYDTKEAAQDYIDILVFENKQFESVEYTMDIDDKTFDSWERSDG